MQVLRKLFGSEIPEPSGQLVTRWASDSFSFGSYSYLPLGATEADYAQLGSALPRLFFAGEATSRRFPSTVHGAFVSGLRAAAEVQKQS
jgi:monoamine oxidase